MLTRKERGGSALYLFCCYFLSHTEVFSHQVRFHPTLALGQTPTAWNTFLQPSQVHKSWTWATLLTYSTRYPRQISWYDTTAIATKTLKIFTQANGILGEKKKVTTLLGNTKSAKCLWIKIKSMKMQYYQRNGVRLMTFPWTMSAKFYKDFLQQCRTVKRLLL